MPNLSSFASVISLKLDINTRLMYIFSEYDAYSSLFFAVFLVVIFKIVLLTFTSENRKQRTIKLFSTKIGTSTFDIFPYQKANNANCEPYRMRVRFSYF